MKKLTLPRRCHCCRRQIKTFSRSIPSKQYKKKIQLKLVNLLCVSLSSLVVFLVRYSDIFWDSRAPQYLSPENEQRCLYFSHLTHLLYKDRLSAWWKERATATNNLKKALRSEFIINYRCTIKNCCEIHECPLWIFQASLSSSKMVPESAMLCRYSLA